MNGGLGGMVTNLAGSRERVAVCSNDLWQEYIRWFGGTDKGQYDKPGPSKANTQPEGLVRELGQGGEMQGPHGRGIPGLHPRDSGQSLKIFSMETT